MLLSFFDCHKGEEVCVHLLANGLRPEEIEKVRNVVKRFNAKFEVYEVDGDFLGSLAQGRYSYITPTTYARLFLPDILPAEVDKVLYLDCDLIVLDSLESLWKYDFDDGSMGKKERLWYSGLIFIGICGIMLQIDIIYI